MGFKLFLWNLEISLHWMGHSVWLARELGEKKSQSLLIKIHLWIFIHPSLALIKWLSVPHFFKKTLLQSWLVDLAISNTTWSVYCIYLIYMIYRVIKCIHSYLILALKCYILKCICFWTTGKLVLINPCNSLPRFFNWDPNWADRISWIIMLLAVKSLKSCESVSHK